MCHYKGTKIKPYNPCDSLKSAKQCSTCEIDLCNAPSDLKEINAKSYAKRCSSSFYNLIIMFIFPMIISLNFKKI